MHQRSVLSLYRLEPHGQNAPLKFFGPNKRSSKTLLRMQQVSLNSKTLTIPSTLNIEQAKNIGQKGAETHLGTINIALALQ